MAPLALPAIIPIGTYGLSLTLGGGTRSGVVDTMTGGTSATAAEDRLIYTPSSCPSWWRESGPSTGLKTF